MAKNPEIDMTAMVDVAFLLLTFFILTTTKFREDASVEIAPPSSISDVQIPDKQVMSYTLDKEGRLFIGFSDIATREKAIQMAASRQDLQITEEGMAYFSGLENFGVPLNQLAGWLNLEASERDEFEQPGIPLEPEEEGEKSDLDKWIEYGRRSDPAMQMAINGDASAPYTSAFAVIDALQEVKLNKFILVTDTEAPPADAEGGEGEE